MLLSIPSKHWPKTFKILPKWRNFAKSGHTEIGILGPHLERAKKLQILTRSDEEELAQVVVGCRQCDQIIRTTFAKCTVTFWAILKNNTFHVNTAVAAFWAAFWPTLGIWSH